MRTEPKVLKTAYKSIFSGDMGKIVMKDLKAWCHIDQTSFMPGQGDQTAYNEGARSVYLRICAMAKINLDRLLEESDS